MERIDPKQSQVISFLSGKGGAGKTSVAIGISYLLNDAGFNVLLVDFDFATNGASYFFKYLYPQFPNKLGLCELLSAFKDDVEFLSIMARSSLQIKKGLHFLPSRMNFSKKINMEDSMAFTETHLKDLLKACLEKNRDSFNFIIIDNQAGSNLTAKVSASQSDKVIIVSELDAISSDAVDTLLIQIGDILPEYRRHLINKLDIHEIEDYKNLSLLFQSMNRLPPLPFDFEVRSSFASRQIPIDANKPNTFSIALFNTVKAFLPECAEVLNVYGEKLLSKYNEYQEKIDSIIDKKRDLEKELDIIRTNEERKSRNLQFVIFILAVYLGIALIISGIIWFKEYQVLLAAFGAIMMISSAMYFYRNSTSAKRSANVEQIRKRLSEIDKEIERYESLRLTRDKEFLLYFKDRQ